VKLINNIIRFKTKGGYTVIYSLDGKEKNYGDISCPSCHDAHRWSFFSNKKASDKNQEGNAKDSFLRNMSYKNVCKDCHGLEALFKYRYFHSPDKRGSGAVIGRD
jgi:hypothetical protein